MTENQRLEKLKAHSRALNGAVQALAGDLRELKSQSDRLHDRIQEHLAKNPNYERSDDFFRTTAELKQIDAQTEALGREMEAASAHWHPAGQLAQTCEAYLKDRRAAAIRASEPKHQPPKITRSGTVGPPSLQVSYLP